MPTDPYEELARSVIGAPKSRRGNYDDIIERHATRTNLDPNLVRAVIGQESSGNPRARSHKNAQGLMQLIPATAKRFGVKNVYDPEENIRGGTEYLKFLTDRYKGNIDKVLAGYNAGEGNVDKFGGIPPFKETRNYVPSVKKRYQQLAGRSFQSQKSDDDPYRQLAEEVLSPSQPDDEYTKLARSVIKSAAPSPSPIPQPKRSRFEGVRAGAQGEAVREYPAMQARRPGIIERATEAIKPYVPGLTSLDTPAGIKLDAPRGFVRGVTLGATGESRPITREDLLVDPDAEAKRNFAEGAGETVGAVVPYIGAGKVLSKVPALAKATRGAHIARNAATFGGVETAREGIHTIKTGESMRPEEIAISTGIGAAMGGIAGVSPSMKRQVVAFLAPQIAVDVARGTPMEQAVQSGLTNLGFALTSGARGKTVIKAPRIRELRARLEAERVKEDARQTEPQRQGVSQEQSAEATQGVETLPAGSVVDRGNAEAVSDIAGLPEQRSRTVESAPQRFYHTQYGNVVKATDQTGARKGKTKIYVEGNPEEIHYPKTVDLRGRGNERMVPLKDSASQPVEVLPEKPQQPSETEAAQPARAKTTAPSPPETLRVEPEGRKTLVEVVAQREADRKSGKLGEGERQDEIISLNKESRDLEDRIRYIEKFVSDKPGAEDAAASLRARQAEIKTRVSELETIGQPKPETTSVEQGVEPKTFKGDEAKPSQFSATESERQSVESAPALTENQIKVAEYDRQHEVKQRKEALLAKGRKDRNVADTKKFFRDVDAQFKPEEIKGYPKIGVVELTDGRLMAHSGDTAKFYDVSPPTGEAGPKGWREAVDRSDDPFYKSNVLQKLASMKSSPQELTDILDRGEQLRKQGLGAGNISNVFHDVGMNRAATPEIKARANRLYEEVFAPERPSSGKVTSPTTLNVEKSLAPEPKVSEQPIKEVTREATAQVTRPESTIVGEGAGLGALERGTAPAPSKRRTKPHDTLVSGERSDISLSQFVRRRGGIVPGEMFAGELDRLRSPDTGTTGLVNQRNVRGGRKMTADYMMEAANEAGFKDPQTGEKFDNVGNFLYAVERDVSTKNIKALTGTEVDFETEYRKHVDAQMAEAKDRDSAIKSADALVSLLEGGRGGELFDKIAANNATPAEQAELRSLARKRFIRTAELEDVIAEAKAEGVSTSFESEREATPSRTERAEQLGFVQEGLTQESARLPPKEADQRARLIQEEKQRQRERNPERAAALDTLATLREKGMTIDEYARQGSLIGETPSRRKLALLRELESGNFGPGAASAKEPFPEVKERKFGKRFVEDERIAQEIRDSIGTAKYYEPIPNKVTAADAKKLVDERGVGQSINAIKDEGNNMPFHVRVAMGEIVALKTNKAYRNLKESNPKEADFILEQANETAEFLMDYGTRLGQGVQAFAMWTRQTPEGILLSYKKGVNKARARQSKFFGEEVKEIVETVNSKMTDVERLDALKNLFKTNKTARKARPEWEKVLKAAKDGKLTDTLFYEIAGERLGLPTYNKEVAKRITELSLEIETAPEGLPHDRAVRKLTTYVAEQKGFDVSDLPLGIFYTHILSGYNTQAVNFVDTGLNVLSEVNGLAMSNPRAAAKVYSGMLRGFTEGRFDAMLALSEGRTFRDSKWLEAAGLMEVARFGQKGGVPIKPATRVSGLAKRAAESKLATPLNAYKYVYRAMAAADAVNARGAQEARASLLAYRMAKAEGLKGEVMETRVREILALDREVDFQKQAEREGFTGSEAKFRAVELRDMVRNKDLSADAVEFAGEATYNHKPHGTLGMFADHMARASNEFKPLKLFVPFTQIVANVTNRGLNWTPYGFKRAYMGWGYGNRVEPITGDARSAMLTRATLGTAGMVLMGALQEAGVLKIHGNGPSDREKRRQLQNTGWRPYSFQIGDTYISYIYSPVGLGISILGNWTDARRYHELQQKDNLTRAVYAVTRLGSTVFSQSFLSGLSRLFGALSEEPGRSVAAVKQTLGGTVSAFGVPNLVRDAHRLFDNKAYQSNTLMEDMVKSTPFAALMLRPSLNALGEPVRLQRQRFVDVQTSDPAWRFVVEKGLRVPVPSRTTEMRKGVRITPDEYYELLSSTGPRLKQWIVTNRARLSKMTEDDAQDELQAASTRIRKFELTRMRMKARRKAA